MAKSDGTTFYFFDFDDNIMFLATPIFILNTETKKPEPFSTGRFADIHPRLGQPGEWEHYGMFEGSYRNFGDIPEDELQPGQKQYFVEDVEKAIESDAPSWQAPSWNLFVDACKNQRPVSIVTARGHSPETIRAGVRVLVEKKLIECEPNYHTIYPVGNDEVRQRELDDPKLKLGTPELKRNAITKSVDKAMEVYGTEPEHCFGMSDDDPQNVDLIIKAMCDCKKRHPEKRFFVINTHKGEMVKLEVFPFDYPVTRQPGSAFSEPLA